MRLDYRSTFVLGFGFLGISIVWAVYNAFVPPILRDYALPWWLVGFVMTLDNILGITMLPYIGQLSDRTRTRLGRRMPYILVGAPVAAVLLVLIPIVHRALPHTGGTLALLTGVIITMNVAMGLFRTPTVALMPDVTPSPLRSKANGIINLMGGLGSVIAFAVGGMLFGLNSALPFLLAAVVMLAAEAIVILRVREPVEYTRPAEGAAPRPGLGESVRDTLANVAQIVRQPDKSALLICLAIFCWFLGYNAIETFWTSYAREVLYAPEVNAGLMTAEQAVGRGSRMLTYLAAAFLVFALPSGFIATRYGRKRTIGVSLGVLAAITLGLRFVHNEMAVTGMLVLAGFAWAGVNINSLPIVADLAPEGKVGAYTGLYYFFSMLAASISPTLVGWLSDVTKSLATMFVFTPATMLLALGLTLAVPRSEPERAAATVADALDAVSEAEF